jgi:GNAT superfamily N-acetyltransferase
MIGLQKVTAEDLSPLFHFIAKEEEECITLVSHLNMKDMDQYPSYILRNESKILGVLMFSEAGLLLSYLPFCKNIMEFSLDEITEIQRKIAMLFTKKKPYCITGSKYGSDFLENCLQNVYGVEPREKRNYHLMVHEETSPSLELKSISLQSSFEILLCNQNDIEGIFPLQQGYDIEEVLPLGDEYDFHAARLQLFTNLKKQRTLAARSHETGLFVSKVSSNAIGINWIQLGGVYTRPQYRGKGIASVLVHEMTKLVEKEGKKVALFVKLQNTPAQKAYFNAGFVKKGSYSILYY